jgi:hypothetical protein
LSQKAESDRFFAARKCGGFVFFLPSDPFFVFNFFDISASYVVRDTANKGKQDEDGISVADLQIIILLLF